MASAEATTKRRDVILVAILAFVSVAIASATIEENFDVEYKWLAAKAWASFDFPSLPANHHNLRWGINIPTTLFIFLFGDSPRSYLTLNFLVFSLGTAGLYQLARSMTSARTAVVILAIWLLNPTVFSLASNLMPEVFGILFLVAGLMLLRSAYLSGSRLIYGVSILFFVLAYGAKKTNLFFMPGLVLYELLRKRFDRVVLITVVFGGCLIFETLIVDILLREHGVLLGRLEVITHGAHVAHMRGQFSNLTPVDMFRRWWFIATTNLDRLQYYSKLLYFVFFAQCAWYLGSLVREAGGKTSSPKVGAPEQEFVFAVLSLGLSFAVCTTFFVISLHPFTMGEPLNDRYLWVLLVPAMLLLTQLLDGRVARICERLAAILTGNGPAHRARSWLAQHSIQLSIVAIVLLGTFSRLLIEGELVRVRRVGYALPYSYLDVNEYYRNNVQQRLADGCTLVFATQRAAWSALIFAFPYSYFQDPVRLYDLDLDQLRTKDGVIHGWEPKAEDWIGLKDKLYVMPVSQTAGDRLGNLRNSIVNRRPSDLPTCVLSGPCRS